MSNGMITDILTFPMENFEFFDFEVGPVDLITWTKRTPSTLNIDFATIGTSALYIENYAVQCPSLNTTGYHVWHVRFLTYEL